MEIKSTTTATVKTMDLDLTEYDQVDEFKLIMENQGQLNCDNSKFLVTTLSSYSDQASLDDANCENDFVFLPGPLTGQQQQVIHKQQSPSIIKSQSNAINNTQILEIKATNNSIVGVEATETGSAAIINNNESDSNSNKIVAHPLITLNSNGNNPFGNYQQQQDLKLQNQKQEINNNNKNINLSFENSYNSSIKKPYGLIELQQSTILGNNANKLADLMQQIVTRSDLIYIAIPCSYCHNESIACPPSDISNWINHMSFQHNCKICPICNKMVGLGPERDINIIKKHVLEHLDSEWLEKKTSRVSFTFGLQQQWFSGSRCTIKDPRHR